MPAAPDDLEERARRPIDAMLRTAGWDLPSRQGMNLTAVLGAAIREFRTDARPADCVLFLGNLLVGLVEAKKAGVTLSSIEAQTRAYASQPGGLNVPVRLLPFLYESAGLESWFTNGFEPEATAERVFSFHRAETLRSWLLELDRVRPWRSVSQAK